MDLTVSIRTESKEIEGHMIFILTLFYTSRLIISQVKNLEKGIKNMTRCEELNTNHSWHF